ncbi:MAG: ABC transporter permease [Clostridia bacterium]|nr:ABC transporter permease [Clostridia bacterium]
MKAGFGYEFGKKGAGRDTMKLLSVAYYTVLRNIRDWKYLILLVMAPIVTILITGVGTEGVNLYKLTEKVKIAYFSEDTGNFAQEFEDFISSEQVSKSFEVKKADSYQTGMDKVKEGKIEAFIYLDGSFTARIQRGNNAGIKIYSANSMSPVKPLVESFINSANTGIAIAKLGKTGNTGVLQSGIKNMALSSTGTAPRDRDKWTYFNMLIFLFYGAIMSGFAITSEYKNNIHTRLNTAPINPLVSITGKNIGQTVTVFMCAVVIILFTGLVFESDWSGNIGIILLVYLLYSAIAVCLGSILGLLVRKISIIVLVIITLDALLFNASGLGWGESGDFALNLSLISPHHYAAEALINNIFDGSSEKINSSLIALAAGAFVMAALSLILGRRKAV